MPQKLRLLWYLAYFIASNTILCFFLIFFIIPTKKAKAEIETHIVTVEAKTSKCSE